MISIGVGGGSINEKERFLSVLNLEPVDRVPCACPLQTGTIDLMKASGAYWPYAHTDPKLMAKLAIASHDVAGIESIRVPFDVTVGASAFGANTGQRTIIRQPVILRRIVTNPQELDELEVPDPTVDGRAPVVLNALKIISESVSSTPIICGIVSPLMLSFQLRGEQEALMDLVVKGNFMKGILEKATEWNVQFAEDAIEAGADVITLVDGMSTGDVLIPDLYKKFALPYQRKVVKSIKKKGIPVILHVCGDTRRNLNLMIQTGANGISIDHQVEIAWAKKVMRGKTAVIGNISPTTALLFGTPDEVSYETSKCLTKGTDVVAPGCGFCVETPLENMRMMVEVTKKFTRMGSEQ